MGLSNNTREKREATNAFHAKPVILYAINENGEIKKLEMDYKALTTIDFAHHQIHEGNYYTCTDYDGDVDTASPKYWHIQTLDIGIRAHTVIVVTSNTAGLVELFENPTLGGNGTKLSVWNNDRNSSKNASTVVYMDPTVTTDGTKLQNDFIGSNNNKTKIGGTIRQVAEFILKQNESYLVKFTPDSDDAKVTFNIEFYEVEAK